MGTVGHCTVSRMRIQEFGMVVSYMRLIWPRLSAQDSSHPRDSIADAWVSSGYVAVDPAPSVSRGSRHNRPPAGRGFIQSGAGGVWGRCNPQRKDHAQRLISGAAPRSSPSHKARLQVNTHGILRLALGAAVPLYFKVPSHPTACCMSMAPQGFPGALSRNSRCRGEVDLVRPTREKIPVSDLQGAEMDAVGRRPHDVGEQRQRQP